MKVSYEENLANCFGLQRRGDSGNGIAFSVRAKGNAGQLLSSDITPFVCRSCPDREKATSCAPLWQGACGHGGVNEPVHAWKFQTRQPGGPVGFRFQRVTGRTPRLPRLRPPLLRLRPRGLHVVPHGIRGGVLLQGPRGLPVLQRPPHGPDGRPPRRSRHPAGARAAVGDLGAEATAWHACRPTPGRRGPHEDLS